MVKTVILELRRSLVLTLVLMLVLCAVYPLAVWGLAQLFFPKKASGSLVVYEDKTIGSALISQRFTGPGFFHSRPSAAGMGHDAAASGGSNLGPVSRSFWGQVKKRVLEYRLENKLAPDTAVPVDAFTASASGLDPHISVENAVLQAGRVAGARGRNKKGILDLIAACMEKRQLGILGEKRVNVLLLNLELEKSR